MIQIRINAVKVFVNGRRYEVIKTVSEKRKNQRN